MTTATGAPVPAGWAARNAAAGPCSSGGSSSIATGRGEGAVAVSLARPAQPELPAVADQAFVDSP